MSREMADQIQALAGKVDSLTALIESQRRQSNLVTAAFCAIVLRTIDRSCGTEDLRTKIELEALYTLLDTYQEPYEECAAVMAQTSTLLQELRNLSR